MPNRHHDKPVAQSHPALQHENARHLAGRALGRAGLLEADERPHWEALAVLDLGRDKRVLKVVVIASGRAGALGAEEARDSHFSGLPGFAHANIPLCAVFFSEIPTYAG